MDDTNPAREDPEYVRAIQDDVRWLGFDWHSLRHASDYFGVYYLAAEKLILDGKAFVCDLSAEQVREYRGTLDVYKRQGMSSGDPVLIHQASYRPPFDAREANWGFTGFQYVYEPSKGSELQYWCQFLSLIHI